MDQEFDLPVEHNGEEYTFKTSLVTFGHSHKFHVNINGQVIIFEPDEERNYRALIPYEEIGNSKNVDEQLLKSIAALLEEVFK